MAEKNGVNKTMPQGTIGTRSTRMNPNDFARNNMAKGGVNAKNFLIKSGQTKTK
jgi:hypothetical protein